MAIFNNHSYDSGYFEITSRKHQSYNKLVKYLTRFTQKSKTTNFFTTSNKYSKYSYS